MPAGQPVPAAPTARTDRPLRIFSVGQTLPSGKVADGAFLDGVVRNWDRYQARGDPRLPKPPAYLIPQASVGLGHEEDQQLARAYAERSDLPAVGWPYGRLWRDGPHLLCQGLEGVPVRLAEWVNAGNYRKLSAEFYEDYGGLGPCLRRVSLLGADIPACKDLGDLPVLVFDQGARPAPNPVAFTEALAQFAGRHPGPFGVRLPAGPGPGALVTFTERTRRERPAVDPKYQALLAALQQAGLDASKLDQAGLDGIMAACQPAAPAAPAQMAEPDRTVPTVPVKCAESKDTDTETGGDKTDPKDQDMAPAKYSERDVQRIAQAAAAAAVAPLQTQVKALSTDLANASARLAAGDARAAREQLAAFCERNKDKILPFELDPKVGPTLIDQALALPDQAVATFAEGKLSPRAAFLKSVENRPAIGKFAERIPAPVDTSDPDAERKRLLSLTPDGRAVLRREEAAKK